MGKRNWIGIGVLVLALLALWSLPRRVMDVAPPALPTEPARDQGIVELAQAPGSSPVRTPIAAESVAATKESADIGGPGQPTVNGSRYFGRVVDRASGSSVAGAELHKWSRFDDKVGIDELLVRTDSLGGFELAASGQGELGFRVSAEGFALALGKVTKGHRTPERAEVFRLVRPASVRGRVVDAHGNPRPSVALWIGFDDEQLQPVQAAAEVPLGLEPANGLGRRATSDEAGAFQFADLPPRVETRCAVLYGPATLWEQRFTLEAGEEKELEIALPDRVTLHGVVVDETGQSAGRLQLWIRAAGAEVEHSLFFQGTLGGWGGQPDISLETERDGSFYEHDVPPGRWLIGPPAPQIRSGAPPATEQFAPLAQLVEVLPEPAEQEILIHVQRGLYIRGSVLDQDGKPASQAYVDGTGAIHGPLPETMCVSDGSFVLGPLWNESYSLSARADDHSCRSEEIAASPGDESVLLRLKPAPAGSIQCQVEGAEDQQAMIWLAPRGRPFQRFGGSASNGEREFEELEDQVYDLVATTEDGRWGGLSGLSPSKDGTRVFVSLEEATTLRVTWRRDRAVTPAKHGILRARRGQSTVAIGSVFEGADTVLRVPAGPLVIELSAVDSRRQPIGEILSEETSAQLGQESSVVFP